MTGFAFEQWIERLDEAGIDFIVVGGYAGVLHGARRQTFDIDIVPAWHEENLERLCDLLRAAGAVSASGPRIEGDAITPALLQEREIMNWKSDWGPIDTLVGIPNRHGEPVDFEQLDRRSVRVSYEGVMVLVASLDDIIESKEFASRRKDAEALPELRRLRDQT